MKKILIIDDEASICTALSFALEDKFLVKATTDGGQALALAAAEQFDFCLLDLRLGKYDGLELIHALKALQPALVILIMTAYATIESSVHAIRNGAYTYLSKPLDLNEVYLALEQAAEYQRLNATVDFISRQMDSSGFYNGMVGSSQAILEVYGMVERLKNVDSSVLITGESGTGKELIAKALHFSGNRAQQHFAAVNCAAIPEGLLESELFGHKKGAFTGAVADQLGKLAYANKGTLFLDEIGDMPPSLQAKLLRVLQAKEYSPIGSNERQQLNVRVISATNKNLIEMVGQGLFRNDLYFRLHVVEIEMPPLRLRGDDIPILISYYIKQNNEVLGRQVIGTSQEVQRKLQNYSYPGNVRELMNIIECAMVMCEGDTIELSHLPRALRQREDIPLQLPTGGLYLEDLLGQSLDAIERRVVQATLAHNHGHRGETARMLGISDKGLRNKLAKYG